MIVLLKDKELLARICGDGSTCSFPKTEAFVIVVYETVIWLRRAVYLSECCLSGDVISETFGRARFFRKSSTKRHARRRRNEDGELRRRPSKLGMVELRNLFRNVLKLAA